MGPRKQHYEIVDPGVTDKRLKLAALLDRWLDPDCTA